MSQVKDVLLLACTAFKSGDFLNAAKLFSNAMGQEGIDGFIDELGQRAPETAKHSAPTPSENTMSPSLASAEVDALRDSLIAMADSMESVASASDQLVDLSGFEQYEVLAADDDSDDDLSDDLSDDEQDNSVLDDDDSDDLSDDEDMDAEASTIILTDSIGPIRLKS